MKIVDLFTPSMPDVTSDAVRCYLLDVEIRVPRQTLYTTPAL